MKSTFRRDKIMNSERERAINMVGILEQLEMKLPVVCFGAAAAAAIARKYL